MPLILLHLFNVNPQVTHVYAEDRLVYRLVEMTNKLAASYAYILLKLDD